MQEPSERGNYRGWKKTLQLGRSVAPPASPDKAQLDACPTAGTDYLARLPRPNSPRCARSRASRILPIWSSTMCPNRLLESKSLKLYLSIPQPRRFHEDCTVAIGRRL